MPLFGKTYFIKIVILMTAFFCACDDERTEVLNEKKVEKKPAAIAYNIRMVYTDSLQVKAILTATEHHDYTNLSLQHSIFPQGLKVVFLDELERENIILADYGILYNNTGIIDLQGNVMLKASDGSALETPQLYWDADAEWIFTEETFNFSSSEYDVVATRLDTNKEFTNFKTGKLTGTVAIQEEDNQ